CRGREEGKWHGLCWSIPGGLRFTNCPQEKEASTMSTYPAPSTRPFDRGTLAWTGANTLVERITTVAGRLLLAQIFLMSALHKLSDWSGTEQAMIGKGLPA